MRDANLLDPTGSLREDTIHTLGTMMARVFHDRGGTVAVLHILVLIPELTFS